MEFRKYFCVILGISLFLAKLSLAEYTDAEACMALVIPFNALTHASCAQIKKSSESKTQFLKVLTARLERVAELYYDGDKDKASDRLYKDVLRCIRFDSASTYRDRVSGKYVTNTFSTMELHFGEPGNCNAAPETGAGSIVAGLSARGLLSVSPVTATGLGLSVFVLSLQEHADEIFQKWPRIRAAKEFAATTAAQIVLEMQKEKCSK